MLSEISKSATSTSVTERLLTNTPSAAAGGTSAKNSVFIDSLVHDVNPKVKNTNNTIAFFIIKNIIKVKNY